MIMQPHQKEIIMQPHQQERQHHQWGRLKGWSSVIALLSVKTRLAP